MQFVGDKEAKYKLSIKYKAIYYGNDSIFFSSYVMILST